MAVSSVPMLKRAPSRADWIGYLCEATEQQCVSIITSTQNCTGIDFAAPHDRTAQAGTPDASPTPSVAYSRSWIWGNRYMEQYFQELY